MQIKQPTAFNLIRNGSHYRRDAFVKGLQAAGYRVQSNINRHPTPEDILVIWNRYSDYENKSEHFERCGARVLVVENGYSTSDKKHFALSIGQHHHGGVGLPTKKPKKLTLNPGKHILVCAQRGIGSKMMRSPTSWETIAAEKLKKLTDREIRVRLHPGKHPPVVTLEKDLKKCHACVVWSSACGVEALLSGVQVFYDAPRWICEQSARKLSDVFSRDVDINLVYSASDLGIQNTFQNQWNLEQIQSGEAFKILLGD